MPDGVELPQFPGYIIYKDGRILGKAGSILTPTINPISGYASVGLRANGKTHVMYVHRLVAAAYLGLNLSDTASQVDHDNEIKSDNRLSNLAIMDQSKNLSKFYSFVYENDTDSHKKCRCCEMVKPRSDFYQSRFTKDGNTIYCRPCSRNKDMKYRKLKLKENQNG